MVALLAGLGGMLGWGFADFFAKKTIDKVGTVASLVWGHIFGCLVLFGIVLYQTFINQNEILWPKDTKSYFSLAIFGIIQALVYLFVYKGFGKGQVGVLSPIFASFSGLTAILSIAIFGEVINMTMLIGLCVLFLGILLINTDIQALRLKRLSLAHVPGFKEIGLATLMAGFWTLFWDRFVSGKDWLPYALLMYVFMTIALLAVAKLRRTNLLSVEPQLWKFLALIGICEIGAYLAISLGYSATSLTSLVALLSGAFSLPTIILARLFLKEKITAAQTIGGLIIIAGIMAVSFK